jgi:hypothetical protein
VTTSSTQPTAQQIEDGKDHTGAAAAAAGFITVGSTGAKTDTASGLTASTAYYAHLVQFDLADNASNRVVSAQFTTAVAPDVTAPTLSSPTDAANGSAAATLNVTTNEANGTLYWFISTSATPPTAANLKTGTGAVSYGNQAVTVTGAQAIAATGLAASTTYYSYFLHRDSTGNDSSISAADGFTTTAVIAPVLTLTSTAGTNPMSWSSFYEDAVIGTDYITMRYRINGGSWIDETDVLFDSNFWLTYHIDGDPYPWPLFAVDTFAGGDVVDVQEGIKRGGVTTWSTSLTDTMASTDATYAYGGLATSAGSSTSVSFSTLPFTAGRALIFLTCFTNASAGTDSAPTSLTLTPSAGGAAINCTKLGSGGRAVGRAFAIYESDSDITATNYNLTGTRPSAARSNVCMYGSLTTTTPTPTTAATFSTGSNTNPHVTSSLTCVSSGLLIGALMPENSLTAAANTGTTLIAQTYFNSECGLVLGTRDTTGTLSFNATPNSTFNMGKGIVAFGP